MKPSTTELSDILKKHGLWLKGEPEGERANLYGVDLRGANFIRANLSGANLSGANFIRANLSGANLQRADLSGVDLRGANLSGADLSGANLSGASLSGASLWGVDLRGANLSGANLQRADLSGVDLRGANLSGADLSGASLWGVNLSGADLRGADLRGADLQRADLQRANLSGADLRTADLSGALHVPFIPMTCPEEGSFIGWKKCSDDHIVKLLIPEDARRSSATGRKCRTDKAVVLRIENLDGSEADVSSAVSNYDHDFVYEVGKTVIEPNFCEDRFRECAPGIHFFINRQEAVEYVF